MRFRRAKLARDQSLRRANRSAASQDCFCDRQLFLRRFQCEQNLGVPDRDQVLGHPCLDLLRQVEQSHCVGHRGPTSTDLLRDLFLAHSKFAGKPRVTLRFFDRIEIGALQIFDQREFQHIAIVRRSNNDRHLRQSCGQRCSPAPLTGD